MDQMSLGENVDILFHSLENFTQKEGVIGKTVIENGKTFLPIVSVTIGYGGGNAAMNKGQSGGAQPVNTSTGNETGALGFGAKLNTEAIIVIDDQSKDVSILPMASAGVSQVVDKIPQILSGMNQNKQSQS